MPIYEYECTKCNKKFELIQGFSAKTTNDCIYCPEGTLANRIVSTSNFALSGAGWPGQDIKTRNDFRKHLEKGE